VNALGEFIWTQTTP